MSVRRSGLVVALASAIAAQSSVARENEDTARFIPAHFEVELVVRGELTGDSIPDAVLLVQGTDPARRTRNDGLGQSLLDTNLRRLLVLQGTGSGFRQIASSDMLVPPKGNADTPCLADPLEDGQIKIERGLIKVNLNYWVSCGSYGTSQKTYTLRVEQGRVRLIGFDGLSFSRASGLGDEISIDYLRGRIKRTSDVVVIGEHAKARPKVRWSHIRPQAIWLEELNVTACDELDPQPNWC
jgi:hypothetical protein